MADNYLELAEKYQNELKLLEGSLSELAFGQEKKSLLLTSSNAGEGKTLVSVSMALRLANNGRFRVLLIDANPNAPKLDKIFDIPASPGLTDMLNDTASTGEAIHTSKINGLDILPAGTQSSLFRLTQFQSLLTQLSKQYDYILADAGHVLGGSEISLCCSAFDGTLLVIECEKTKHQVVKAAAEKITASGGKLLATVMNRRKFYIPRYFYG